MKRIYIFTGKGGVGKSSIAAAHAVKSAQEGKKTLLVSTDMAHNLGDIFEQELGKEARNILPGLDVYEIDPEYVMENDFSAVMSYLASLFPETDGSAMQGIGMIPGMEELFSLLKIAEIYRQEDYERIIVDCAPTGETLSLLKFPELLSWYMEKFFPIGKVAVRLRVVTTPEKIVISEAKRNFTCLYLYQYNVDAVIVNHIYPAEAMKGYFNKWTKMQEEALQEIAESFSEVPRFYVELQQRELRTLEMLESVGDQIFGACDPDDVLFCQKIYEVNTAEKSLVIYLPFASKEELRLEQERNELLVGVRNENRRFPIPPEFAGMEVTGAKFEEGYLKIRFGAEI